ncbi:hypothetical protein M407DRAFT_31884 [Tulasnella calospora MUT 4182]|uniref:Uncharacterized protein n=1 Tax=Tulasnella calospora MUT 4182 TaxID=1051891 RepID=A0A0C3Q4Z6_9AGAM|nr:hypothetical protein M407DRAFT_31884 [Tulasnella calospora MUT 4182]
MHLLENTIKNYIGLICGDFKDLGPGVESYVLPSAIWKEIGSATAISNDTIPSAFGRRVPNVAEDRTYMTAEAHLVWATMYSRILLRGRFSQERYYIWHPCTILNLKSSELSSLRRRIAKYLVTQYSITTTVADSCIPDLAE